jgi:hypothetical protein
MLFLLLKHAIVGTMARPSRHLLPPFLASFVGRFAGLRVLICRFAAAGPFSRQVGRFQPATSGALKFAGDKFPIQRMLFSVAREKVTRLELFMCCLVRSGTPAR